MREELDAIRAQLARIESGPGIAKASGDLRSKFRTKAHEAFCAGVEHLLLNDWSMRRIAQHMEVDPVTLKDWYEQGDRQRSQLPAWALAALPSAARAAVLRVELGWSDPSPDRTGTDG
jgi:hypothetical protein